MRKIFSILVAALFCTFIYADKAVTINQSGSATTTHFPVFGDNADNKGQKMQAIYLADQLKGIAEGSEIQSLTFYSANQTQSWGKAEFKVSLAKTDNSFFKNESGAYATASDGSSITKVYEGSLAVADGELTIKFTKPYTYEGGNLLIQVEITTAGTSAASSFYSATTDYLIKYATSGSSREQKQPKVTFVIAGGGDDPVSETCEAPTAVTVETVTESTATISWQGEASQYQYCLEYEGDLPDWTAATLTDQKSVSFTGLYDEEKYYFYVRSYCSETEVSEYVKATFKTACARLKLPWLETFTRDAAGSETVGDVAPECWIISSAAPAVTIVAEKEDDGNGNMKPTGQQHLNARGGGVNSAQVFALPLFDAKLDTCELAFDYYTNVVNEDYGKLEIGYMTNPADAATFVSLKKFDQTLTNTHEVFTLDVLPAGIEHIAFRFAGGTSDFGSVNMDNFVMAGIGHSDEVDPSQEILPDANILALTYCEAQFTWYSYNAEAFAIAVFDGEAGKLIGGITVTTGECDRFAQDDGIGFSSNDDYENKYYCSTKWILNVEDGGLQKGESWDKCVINVGTAVSPILALAEGQYQIQIYELVVDGENYSLGESLATIPFELVSKHVTDLKAVVADDFETATLTWTEPELGNGERLYVSVRAGEVVAFDNFDDKKLVATSPMTVDVAEGLSYTAYFQIIDRNRNPLGYEIQTQFTVGTNNFEPTNLNAEVFGGDNVTFSWDAAQAADRYVITLFLDGAFYTTLTVSGSSKTTTMPEDGTWTWTVQAFNVGSNGNYFEASKPVDGNAFETKAADIPEDAIVLNVWKIAAAYMDVPDLYDTGGRHAWYISLATGEEDGKGLPSPIFMIYSNKDDAISGVYNVSRGNIDLSECGMDMTGEQADAVDAVEAELRLQFDGFDEDKIEQGYYYGYYSGQFRIVGKDGKTYVGKFMEVYCNSFNFSSFGAAYLDYVGMYGEDSDPQAVETVVACEGATKVIENGAMYIIREGVKYDVVGRQIN